MAASIIRQEPSQISTQVRGKRQEAEEEEGEAAAFVTTPGLGQWWPLRLHSLTQASLIASSGRAGAGRATFKGGSEPRAEGKAGFLRLSRPKVLESHVGRKEKSVFYKETSC